MEPLTTLPTSSLPQRHTIIDPTTDGRWEGFVAAHPRGSIFHTSAWARVLIETYGYEPRYHILEGADGRIEAAWPLMLVASPLTGRRLVALPFCDHCPPLVQTPAQAEQLLDAVVADQEDLGVRHIEVRGWPFGSSTIPDRLIPISYYKLYTLELPDDPSEMYKRIDRRRRSCVRQAERRGVTTRLAEDRRDVERFYALNVSMRRRHEMLPQPFALFDAIDRYLLHSGMGYIMLAEIGARLVAADLCLIYKDTVTDKFAPSDPVYWQYRPNDLLQWRILEWACLHGFHLYDAGRCGAEDAGLAYYKERWGLVARSLPYYYYPTPGGFSTTNPRGVQRRVLSLFARLAPSPIYEAAGRHLYRHLG